VNLGATSQAYWIRPDKDIAPRDTMEPLMAELLVELRKIDGVEDRPSAVSGGTALFYRGKAFAHFHNGHELDLRLTKARTKELGLSHPRGSVDHPDRSPNSPWIEVRFNDRSEIVRVKALVEIAISEM
jgi:Family of unknown function (DUF5519)